MDSHARRCQYYAEMYNQGYCLSRNQFSQQFNIEFAVIIIRVEWEDFLQ